MKNKKILLSAAIILSIIAGTIYKNRYFNDLGTFLFLFSLALIIIFIVLYFVKNEGVFKIWRNFAGVYLSIAIILAVITPDTPGFLRPDSEIISLWLAGIFFVVSLGIILGKRDHHSPLDLDEC
ncbi:MAG: hypothetical protein OEV93_00980 [Candidatus Moranbacteria bacterium]|nr:hypothetical protein [Candidatus Moranbacteria bacterium]